MSNTRIRAARWVLAAALALPLLSGCLVAAAAGAGAGAGAGIWLTRQGASSLVEGSIDEVERRTLAVLADDGVEVADRTSEDHGRERGFGGMRGELEVRVKLEAETTSTTRVSATARYSMVEWDREYARTLLQRIVERR